MSNNLSDVSRQRELHSVVSNSEVTPINISEKLKTQSQSLATLTLKVIDARITELNTSVAAEKKVGWWSRGTDNKIAMKAKISDLKKTQKEIQKLEKKLDKSKTGEAGIKEIASVSKKIEEKALSLFPKPVKSHDSNRISQDAWRAIVQVEKSVSELIEIYKTQINKSEKLAFSTQELLNSQPYNIDNESKFEDEIKPLKKQCSLILREIEKIKKLRDLEIGNKNPVEFCGKIERELIQIEADYTKTVRKSQLEKGIKNLQIEITNSGLPPKLQHEWESKLKSIKTKGPYAQQDLYNLKDRFNKFMEKHTEEKDIEKFSANPQAYLDEASSKVESLKQEFDHRDDSLFQFRNRNEFEANRKIIQNFPSLNLASNHGVTPEATQFAKAVVCVNRLEKDFNAFNAVNEDVQQIYEKLHNIKESFVDNNNQLKVSNTIRNEFSADLNRRFEILNENLEKINIHMSTAKTASDFNSIAPLCKKVLKEAEEIYRILDVQSDLHESLKEVEEDLMSRGHSTNAIKPIMEFLTKRATLVTNAAALGEDECDKALSKFEEELEALQEIFKGKADCMSIWISQEERFLQDLQSGAGNEIDLKQKKTNYNNLVARLNESTDIEETKAAFKRYLLIGAELQNDRARNAGWEFISERRRSVSELSDDGELSEDGQLPDMDLQRKNSLEPETLPSRNWSDVAKEAETRRNDLKSETRSERVPSTESEDGSEYEWPDDEQNPDLHRTNSLGSESSASRERSSSEIDPSSELISELRLHKSPPNLNKPIQSESNEKILSKDAKTFYDSTPELVKDYKTQISEISTLAKSTQDLLSFKSLNIDSAESQQLEESIKPLKEQYNHLLGNLEKMNNVQDLKLRNKNLSELPNIESKLKQIQIDYNLAVKKIQLHNGIKNLREKITSSILPTKVKQEWILKLQTINSIGQVYNIDRGLDRLIEENFNKSFIENVSTNPENYFNDASNKVKIFNELITNKSTNKSLLQICNVFDFNTNISIIENFIQSKKTIQTSSLSATPESIKFAEALLFFNQLEKDFSAFNEINNNVKIIKKELDAIENYIRGNNQISLDRISPLRERYQEIISLMENTNTYNPPNYIEIANRCKTLLSDAIHFKNILEAPDDDYHAQEVIPISLDKEEDEGSQGTASIDPKSQEPPRGRSSTFVDNLDKQE